MGIKNYAIAFQIAAAFRGNSAFTDAAQSIKKLKAEYRDIGQKLQELNGKHAAGTIPLQEYISKQKELGKLLEKNKRQMGLQSNLSQAQGQFEGSFNNMTKYGANAYQFFQMSKSVISLADTAMSFEEKMSKVKAITRGSAADMELLEAKALELGKTTRFSATEAADAMSFLGMAGWKTQEIMSGMPGLLSLAAAGGVDLARTADIVSDDLTAFGLSADKAAHMADVFATVITSTNTNVELLGETMKYAAPVATAFGASMEETSAMAGLMANAGIKASQAGTSLRAGFLRLAGPPKKAANEMAELGIDMSEMSKEQAEAEAGLRSLGIEMDKIPDDGNKMATIIQKIAEATAGMGKEQKLAALQAIFGTTAASGWLSVINQGPDKLRELTRQLMNCDGAAEDMAKTMTDNAKGKVITLKSAMESLSIAAGKTLLPALGQAAQLATAVAEKFGNFASNHPVLVGAFLNTALAIAAIGASANGAMWAFNGFKTVISGLKAVFAWFQTFSVLGGATATMAAKVTALKLALVALPFTAIIAGVAAIAAVVALCYTHWDTLCQVAEIVGDKISVAWGQLMTRLQPAFDRIQSCIRLVCNSFGILNGESDVVVIAMNTLGSVITAVFMAAMTVIEWFVNQLAESISSATKILINLSNFVNNVLAGEWAAAWENIKNIAITPIEFIKNTFGNLINSITNGVKTIMGFGSSISSAPLLTGGGPGIEDIPRNASGGIYGKGAFLTTFAEESGESAIPHTPTARNIGLLARTNEIMGSPLGGNSYNISIPITVNGSADSTAVQSIAGQVEEAVRRALDNLQRRQGRLSYA